MYINRRSLVGASLAVAVGAVRRGRHLAGLWDDPFDVVDAVVDEGELAAALEFAFGRLADEFVVPLQDIGLHR